jgi:uncharacterized protein with LGFP repeats
MLVALVAACVAAAALVAIAPATSARALSGSDFNPGFIISDDLFYNGSAMTSAQIQTFLNGKIGTCTNGKCLNVAKVPLSNRAATFGTRTGNLLCAAITGGTLSVAELIYRTQVACGISAKVILVTLQKEEGLVTSRAPSDSALKKAMGMACPDTAACNSAFAGLATQIITGSEQLKDYKANVFGRQPGVNYIQYNPNTSCGGTNVNILDYGTAALYNYTPYQPNAAALGNLSGVGNGCSSYGNRNFWVYYNNWFGSPTVPPCTSNPTRDITDYWTDQGGASSALGALVSPGIVAGPAGTTIGNYANGALYCTPKVGPVPVLGDLRVKYDALGGPGSAFGAPLTPQSAFTANGITGVLQTFRNGSMQDSSATGAFGVMGPIRTAWGALGGSGGTLGWPTGDQETVAGGVRQQFQNGLVMVPAGKPAIIMTGAIEKYWTSEPHAASLGSPTTSASAWTAGGVTGTLEYFDRGMVLSSTTTGTFAVLTGPMRNAWGRAGGSAGPIGWPTGDQQPAPDGGVSQTFQGGTLFASASGASGSLSGAIASYWAAGSNASLLGYPTKNAVPWTAGGVTGTLQYFERGLVLSSTATGTHGVIAGLVYKAWGARGGSGGSLGWPIGDLAIGSTLTQKFQGGTLSIASGVTGAIASYWAVGGNASLLGSPTGAASSYSAAGISGQLQYFANGLVMSSTTTGTFSVLTGPIRTGWGKLGGSGGTLGWPIGDQATVSGMTQQTFQHGTIVVAGSKAVTVSGAIADYWTSDEHAEVLGLPTTSTASYSAGGVTGALQYFANGLVMSSTSGTFAVLVGPIRSAWGALGGSGGSLGWPSADETDIAGGAQQAFQHGTVIAPAGGAAIVLSGAIASYWSSGSNASLLGMPTASAASYSAGGVSGMLQNFERGLVMSSTTTGTFSVLIGAVRDEWGLLGGSGGSLGWPTTDQSTASGNVTQRFQHGTITIFGDGSPVLVSGAYFTYWSTGSNAATVGNPTAAPIAWIAGGVTGSYQVYEHAMIMSSTTTGTYAVLNGPIRTVWGGAGGSGGALGWPIGDQAAVSSGVQQKFQHGTVTVPTSGSPYATYN